MKLVIKRISTAYERNLDFAVLLTKGIFEEKKIQLGFSF
jgi:hypothetical protein